MKPLDPQEMAERVAEFIRGQSGERAVDVRGLQRLAGGSSRQVWALDVTLGRGAASETLALVLRINPTGLTGGALAEQAVGFEGEFRLLEVMQRHRAPVPRVYWSCEEREPLGGPFYLMERIEGETIPRRLLTSKELAAARERLPEQLGRALARIHSADLEADGLDWLPGPGPGQSAPESQLAQIRQGIDVAPQPSPTLELAYRWLEQSVPSGHEQTLVHGDYRVGNVIVGPDGLRAVLDWELAHRGDPHEDLAWMCTKTWRFGNVERPVGGVGPRAPFYEAYEAESGRKLDREALRFWEVLCSARVAIVWVFQVLAHLSGAKRSVEQAAIGRRMAETELDLIELLE